MQALRSIHYSQLLWFLLFAFPVYSLQWAVNVAALVFLAGLTMRFFNPSVFQKTSIKAFLPLIFIVILGLFYLFNAFLAKNFTTAWFEFEKRMGFIALPLLVFLLPKKSKTSVLLASSVGFVSSTLLLSVSLLGIHLFFTVLGTTAHENYFFVLRSAFESVWALHPTYFGLFNAISILVLIHVLTQFGLKKSEKRVGVLIVLILTAALFLVAARAAILALLVGSVYYLIAQKQWKLLFPFLIGLAAAGWLAKDSLQPRIEQVFQMAKSDSVLVKDGTSIRRDVYNCSLNLLEYYWLTGAGAENVQNELNGCYYLSKTYSSGQINLNTHNEFLNQWLSWGISGLLLLLAFLFSVLYTTRQQPIGVAIWCVLFIQLFTENVLARQHGVFLVLLTFSLLLYAVNSSKASLKSKLPSP